MKHDIHILLFQNIFYLIIKENRKYAVIILSLQFMINTDLDILRTVVTVETINISNTV